MSTDMPETDKPLKRVGNPNWIKGGASPNPSGRTDKPIAMLARMHAPHALKTLITISKDERAPHAARVSRITGHPGPWLWPPSLVQHSATATQFKRAIDMTDDELAAIMSGAKLTVIKCTDRWT